MPLGGVWKFLNYCAALPAARHVIYGSAHPRERNLTHPYIHSKPKSRPIPFDPAV